MSLLKRVKGGKKDIILLLNSGLVPFIDKKAFASGHVPFPNGGVGRSSHHESVEHSNTIDVARVTPVQKKRKLHSVYQQSLHEGISKSKCR